TVLLPKRQSNPLALLPRRGVTKPACSIPPPLTQPAALVTWLHMRRSKIPSVAAALPEQTETVNYFITVNQLLDRLPISRRTLSEHRKKGVIPWINLGGRVLFDWESVRAALLRQQRRAE